MANAQLTLVPVSADWKLDEQTKRIGRAGLAQARAALAQTSTPVLMAPTLISSTETLLESTDLSSTGLLAA